jgi:8-oxo-dGTP pyrophosphatase MutT (NUDIX family)
MWIKQLEEYKPVNEQERVDQLAMIAFAKRNGDALSRDNLVAHFTSSAIVLNRDLTKVLFIHHNIYNSWGWVGGHNDGDDDFLYVSIKEAQEETGVNEIIPLNKEIQGIDTIYVSNHMKNGKLIPDHVHMNLTYFLIADEKEKLVIKQDENSGVRWFSFEEALHAIDEPRMRPIYEKLFHRVLEIKRKIK